MSPNSNFVSARMTPRVWAYDAAVLYSSNAIVEIWEYSSAPMRWAAWAGEMFSSWAPCSALVEGVKSGSGSCWDSTRPAGRGMPWTVPDFLYSDHAEPVGRDIDIVNVLRSVKK